MKINFFETNCQETPISAIIFGICDDDNKQPSYTDCNNPDKWVAVIKNPEAISIIFTAIDNCIDIRRTNGDQEKRCDSILTYHNNIVFVELKNQAKDWITDAIEQLEITIQYFMDNHDITKFKHKRAFACNKKHPTFQVIYQETKRRFWDKYHIRLDIQATIAIP